MTTYIPSMATVYMCVESENYTSVPEVLAKAMPWLRYSTYDNMCLWDGCFQILLHNTNCKHKRYYITSDHKMKVME